MVCLASRSLGSLNCCDICLVSDTSAPALTEHYLLDTLPRYGLFLSPEHFIFAWLSLRSFGRLCSPSASGSHLIGVASAPLPRVSLGAMQPNFVLVAAASSFSRPGIDAVYGASLCWRGCCSLLRHPPRHRRRRFLLGWPATNAPAFYACGTCYRRIYARGYL